MNTEDSDGIIEMSVQEMDALIARTESVLADGLSLEPDDVRLILTILRQFMTLQHKLEGSTYLKERYLKLMGLMSSSESRGALDPDAPQRSRQPRKKKNKVEGKAPPPRICHHAIEGLEKGQPCPECDKGRLYKHEPASFIRIVGQPPLAVENHILEQLRCHLCGKVFTAELPAEVAQDGNRYQRYGYSARTMMAINKCYMGSPYYRQESLQSLLGRPVTASTIFDQCAHLADDVMPVWEALQQVAANAGHFHIDDTGNRILSETAIEKPQRNGKGTRKRTGVYSSCLIATLDGEDQARLVVLFQTNIGHAGEWIDTILALRDGALSAPLVMSDALTSNHPREAPTRTSLCNAHSRRKFVEVKSHFPDEVSGVLDRYAAIWTNEREAEQAQMTPAQRLDHHREHSLPAMEGLKAWCEAALAQGSVEENSGLGKAIRYYLSHYEGLAAFCHIEGAKLDNNLAEQLLKLIARCRKNALFYKTQAGAHVGDVITSLLATCEQNEVNGYDYLLAIQQHRRRVAKSPGDWLPWNYRQALGLIETDSLAA
ncbi:MAG: IS66 family transposase [Chromatiaceae bacterium]